MDAFADELRRSLQIRSDALYAYVRELQATLGAGRPGLANALELIREYPKSLKAVADAEWDAAPDATTRVPILQGLMARLVERTSFIEDWFSGGANLRVPLSLI